MYTSSSEFLGCSRPLIKSIRTARSEDRLDLGDHFSPAFTVHEYVSNLIPMKGRVGDE